jgi:hypothetical protein
LWLNITAFGWTSSAVYGEWSAHRVDDRLVEVLALGRDEIRERRHGRLGSAERHQRTQRRQPRAHVGDDRRIALADQQHFDRRGLDHVLELGRLGAVVERDEHGAGSGGCVVCGDVLVRVRLQGAHPVAGLHKPVQRVGEPAHRRPSSRVREAPILGRISDPGRSEREC